MNFYTKEEIQILKCKFNPCFSLTVHNLMYIYLTFYRVVSNIEYRLFISLLDSRGDWANIDLDRVKYQPFFDNHLNKRDLKELFDVIFKLEFIRVPLIINDLPEIANWRLGINK